MTRADSLRGTRDLVGTRSRTRRPTYRHPVNQAVFDAAPLGARVADRVTGFLGSWKFIVIQTAIVAIWLATNIVLLSRPFDPFPFILLNLAFSTQAAYAAPLILLAGNRATQRDRLTLEHAAEEGDLGDAQNERLLRCTSEILECVAALEARILAMEQTILVAASASQPVDARRESTLTGSSPRRTVEVQAASRALQDSNPTAGTPDV
jgi:uncharacterized membrane protein